MQAFAQPQVLAEAPPEGTGSANEEARRKQVLVKVDDTEITLGKVEDFLASQPPMMRARYQTREELTRLVDNMVRLELLAGEAQRKGYDKNPTVARTVKDSSVQALLRVDIDEKFSPKNVPAADVKSYYDENQADFHRPATRRASQIVVATEEEAKALLPEVQKADVRAFAELVRNKSIDAESKLRSGDLGYFSKEPRPGEPASINEAVRNAAFSIKANGETASAPVAVPTGFAIVRMTGERPERNTNLAEADSTIRTKLWREQRQKGLDELIEKLRAQDKPQVFAERAEWVKFDDMEKRPAGFAPEQRPRPDGAQKGAVKEAPGAQP